MYRINIIIRINAIRYHWSESSVTIQIFVNKKQRVVQRQGASNIAVLLFPTLMFAGFHNHAVYGCIPRQICLVFSSLFSFAHSLELSLLRFC